VALWLRLPPQHGVNLLRPEMPAIPIGRRTLLASIAILVAPLSAHGLDAAPFGVRPGALDDQSHALQRAIDEAARRRAPPAPSAIPN